MEGILECPVCVDQFDRTNRLPLVLLCGHTLCKRCATNLIQNSGRIICPLDRKLDNRPLLQISHSFHILELIERISDMSQTLKYLKLDPNERLVAIRKQANENLEKCKDHIEQIDSRIVDISHTKESILGNINSTFTLLKEALEERESNLKTEVTAIASEKIEKFEEVKSVTQELFDKTNIIYETLMSTNPDDVKNEDLKPINQLPELPIVDLKLKFSCDAISAQNFIKNLGKVGKWSVAAPIECDNYTNVTYWMVPSCCSQYYCCNKCHDRKESHSWVYANRMVCMYCEKEQDYRKLPNHCEYCNQHHRGVVSRL